MTATLCSKTARQIYDKAGHTQQSRTLWNLFRASFGSFVAIERPGAVSPGRPIPPTIRTPEYWPHGRPNPSPTEVEIKTPEQIEGMRRAARLAREVMDTIGNSVRIGVTTDELDRVGHGAALVRNCYPSPLNYRGFPKSICTSVNNVSCHGIPDDRPLLDGDIISVDVTVFHEGYHGDCCETWCLPGVDEAGKKLVHAARMCRDRAISECGPGVPFARIGEVCDVEARMAGFSIVPVFIGHGIGSYFHGPPDIYHFANNETGSMAPGMCFTVEPVVTQGREGVSVLADGWTALMIDGGRAAQFEHTVLITDTGHDILTDYLKRKEDQEVNFQRLF